MHTLAIGPDRCANSYSGCTVNGLRFHTKDHDHGQTIQNSGIPLPAFHGKLEVHLYGILCEVLELHYRNKRVLLLKCEWFDTNQRKSNIRNEKGFVSINISRRWYEDQPFILVNEAEQVFYVDDYKFGMNWKVVQFVQPRHLWDIPEIENDEEDIEDQSSEPWDLVITRNMFINGSMEFDYLNRADVKPTVVEGNVMGLKLNMLDDSTTNMELSEDDDSLPASNSDSFDALNSHDTDGEQVCELLIKVFHLYFVF